MAFTAQQDVKLAHNLKDKLRTEDIQLKRECEIDFSDLLLSPHILQGLKNAGFVRPSPIQLEAIPFGRCGADLIVQAKSGTGKTCVFAVIALESIKVDNKNVQVLVLAPTREIVVQVHDVVVTLASAMPDFKCDCFIGGIPFSEDKIKMKNCQMVIGTPGRIQQLIKENVLKTNAIRLFVLDEADKLLEENFQPTINWIYHKLPSSKQMLALSATYPETLAQLLAKYMQTPTFVRISESNPALIGIKQYYKITEFHPIPAKAFENKVTHVLNVLSTLSFGQCIIFSNYQMRAQALCDRLNARGWPATYISGKKEQTERLQAISSLRQFKCRVLISTDLTSRGIDIENVNLIMNLDVPWDLETYLHRIGRAGRYGSHGIAITFTSDGEEEQKLMVMKTSGHLNITRLPGKLGTLWENIVTDKDQEENDMELRNYIPSMEDVSQEIDNDPEYHPQSLTNPSHLKSTKVDGMESIAVRKDMHKMDLITRSEHQEIPSVSSVQVSKAEDLTLVNINNKAKGAETEICYDTIEEDENNLREFIDANRETCNVCCSEDKEIVALNGNSNKVSITNKDNLQMILTESHETLINNIRNDQDVGNCDWLLKMLCEVLDCPLKNSEQRQKKSDNMQNKTCTVKPKIINLGIESQNNLPEIRHAKDTLKTDQISMARRGCKIESDNETSEEFHEEGFPQRTMLDMQHPSQTQWLHQLHATKYQVWFSEYVKNMYRFRKRSIPK